MYELICKSMNKTIFLFLLFLVGKNPCQEALQGIGRRFFQASIASLWWAKVSSWAVSSRGMKECCYFFKLKRIISWHWFVTVGFCLWWSGICYCYWIYCRLWICWTYVNKLVQQHKQESNKEWMCKIGRFWCASCVVLADFPWSVSLESESSSCFGGSKGSVLLRVRDPLLVNKWLLWYLSPGRCFVAVTWHLIPLYD